VGRIAQVNPAGGEYFLPDALGSVRQVVDASGTIVRTQSFDPYGNLLNSDGSTLTSYGFTGEWTDGTSLQYLRARYYSPEIGSFLSRDPFPGSLNQPAALNAYSYTWGNPIRYTDPSGHCIDGISTVVCGMVLSAGVGAVVGAGVDIGAQIINMHPQSPGQLFNCLNWGEVWVAAGAGAISGLAGFASFGAFTAIFGSSLIPTLGAGAVSGVIAGQYGLITQLALTGQLSQARNVMFQPKDILIDAIAGGTISGIGFELGKLGRSNSIPKDRPVIVIGENMKSRVNVVKESLLEKGYDVHTYEPGNFRSSPGNLSRLDLEADRSWLSYWVKEKEATVVDIGIDPSRPRALASPFYDLEQRSIYRLWNYKNIIQYDPGF
jgi:RHS repeat-associated protein